MPRTLPDGTRVYARAEIGYRHGRGRRGTHRRRHFIKHTGVSPTGNLSVDAEMALCRAFERYHVGTRKMAGIAYSWLTGHSGTIYEGRGWGYDGSHTQNGGNTRGYASCTIGDHTRDVPTAAAWRADRALIRDGIAAGALEPDYEVSGHGGWFPKECPGQHIRTRMHTELAHDRVTEPQPQEDEDMNIRIGSRDSGDDSAVRDLEELVNNFAVATGSTAPLIDEDGVWSQADADAFSAHIVGRLRHQAFHQLAGLTIGKHASGRSVSPAIQGVLAAVLSERR